MRTIRAIGLVILTAAVALQVTPASGGGPLLSISAGPTALVSEEWLRFGSIARIGGTDQELMDKVSELRLGRSPSPGETLYLHREDLLARLKGEGVDLSQVELSLPEKIQVIRKHRRITADDLRRFFVGYISRALESSGYQVKVEDVDVGEGITVPAGKVSLSIPPEGRRNLLGRVILPIVVKVDNKEYARIRGSGYVRGMMEVLVANRRLDRSRTIKEGDFRLEMMDMSGIRGIVITAPSLVVGKRVRRSIEADGPILEEAIEVAPLVKRGDMVTILAQGRYLLITTPGKVVEDGYRGRLVKVINLTSKKQIYGKVMDSNTVRVEY